MTDLKPCPFCGAQMHREWAGYAHPSSDTCPLDSLYIEKRHVAAWNTRAAPPEAQALAEALREAADMLDFWDGAGGDARAILAKWEARHGQN